MNDGKPCPDRQAALAPRDSAINVCRETKAAMLADVEQHADAIEGLLGWAILERDAARDGRGQAMMQLCLALADKDRFEQRLAALRKGTAATVRKLRGCELALERERAASMELCKKLNTLWNELMEARASRPWWRVWG